MSYSPTNRKLTAALMTGALLMGGLTACKQGEPTSVLLAEAKQYQQKGDLKAALIQLKNAVQQSPEDGEARIQLATLQLEMGDLLSADKELRKARTLGVAADRVQPLLGRVMLQQRKFKELLEEITPEQAADSAQLLSLRAEALLATGMAADAKQSFDQALALSSNDGNILLGLSRHALSQNDLSGAQSIIDQAVEKDPKNPEVWIAKASMFRIANKQDDALAAYDQALKLKPDHRSAHIEKAYVHISRGKFAEAKAEIDAASRISPNDLQVLYVRGLHEFSQGKYAAAQEQIQRVLKSMPDHMPSVLLASASSFQLGQIQQAEHHVRRYLENNPNDVYSRKLLAQILLKSAQPGDAALTLEPALKNASQDPQLLALAGEAYMQVRAFDKASNYLEKAVELAPKAAAARTSLGLSKLAQGEQARGLSELQLATMLDPKSLKAGLALVQTELELGHYEKALAAVEALEKQQPQSPQVQNIKGAVYMSRNERANARAAFDKALSLQPDFFPVAVNLARMDMQENKPDAARGRFEKLLQADKDNISAMDALGDLALAQKRVDEATSWYEKSNNAKPDSVGPAVKLAMHYLYINQPAKALTLAKKYATLNPTNPAVLGMLGQVQLANEDPIAAVETYSKVVNIVPKSAHAHVGLANAHIAAKNDAAAMADLKRALELQPDLTQARLIQIDMAMRNKRFDEAITYARHLQKSKASAALGHSIEGDMFLLGGKPGPAVDAYGKAFTLNKSYELVTKSARALIAAGKVKEAQARIAQWIKTNPEDVKAKLLLSDLFLADKAYKSAIASLEQVQKQLPNNPLLLNNLAWAYQMENDPRALATAEQAYKLASKNAGVMDTLGWILLEQGNTARALSLLQDARALSPNSPEISYHYAVGLYKSGNKQEARKELEKLLAENKNFPQIKEANALLNSL